MKKNVILLWAILCLPLTFYAQSVQLTAQNKIDIQAAEKAIAEADQTLLEKEMKAYEIYEIDVQELNAQVKRQGASSQLDFRFPSRANWEIDLVENNMRAPNYRAVAMTDQGEVELTPTPIHTYKGETKQGEHVRLNISEDRLRGFIKTASGLLYIEPLSSFTKAPSRNLFVVFHQADVIPIPGGHCGVTAEMEAEYLKNASTNLGIESVSAGCAILDLATEADFEYFQDYGSNVNTANNMIEGDMNLVDGLFQSQIGLTITIVFQRVWSTSNDPYTESGSPSLPIVQEIRDEWNNNMTAIQRDLVHMWSGKNHGGLFGSVGTGGIGVVCLSPELSYGFTADRNMGFETTAHEIGHNFAGIHGDGTGCGSNGATTMCQGSQKDLNFSAASITRLTNFINANCGCLLECCNFTDNFPFSDSYEFGLGNNWTQDDGDDTNWTRKSGGTTSTATGPSSAYDGSFYMYVESSFPHYPSKVANLVSPCLNLYDLLSPRLTFAYHMYGSNMGTLNVQVSEDGGMTWTTIWTRSGDQGNQWNTSFVELTPYEDNVVQLRFNGITGNGYRSDIAIDQVRIGPPCSISASPNFHIVGQAGETKTSIVIPSGESWNITTTNSPWLTVSPTSGSGLSNQTITMICAANNTTGGRNASVNVNCGTSFATSITLVQAGIPNNPIPCGAPFANLPSNQGFESGVNPWLQDANDDINWTRKSGGTTSSATGPSSANSGTYYMYVESSLPNYPSKIANLVSPCYDLNGTPDPEISFAYHMYGSSMGILRLQVSTTGGSSWSTLWSRNGDQGNTWRTQTVSLSNYRNVPILLRFNGTTGTSYRSDMAIDDISVVPGGCFDQYEGNDTYQTAHVPGTGTSFNLTGACLSAGDYDYYRFFNQTQGFTSYYVRVRGANSTVTGDYRLTINLNGNTVTLETHPENGSTTDTYLTLYNSNGTSILTNNDNSGTGLFSRIVYNLPALANKTAGSNPASNLELTNFPNPFNDRTTFSFSLTEENQVTLSITDRDGKVVARPVQGTYSKGTHQIEFDASDLPMGVYFYSLQTASGIVTKQMVIAR